MKEPEQRHGISDEDIERIIQAAQYRHPDVCRFDTIKREEMEEAIRFARNLNQMMEDSKRTVRNTLLGIMILIIVGLMTEGFWGKIISRLR